MDVPTLIKDLIDIPERVHRGDFVLVLSKGVERPDETVSSYVVTPQLKVCFDNALGFIKSAIDSRSSKAAYLHGSFGTGKSHFMAVLDLLLAGNAAARSISEFADVIAKHNAWTEGRKFLMVPYHMIGARDLESAILGQYAEHVRALHPKAPLPGFYLAEKLFEDAQKLRVRMGDDAFFAALNEGKETDGGGGWGALGGGGWDLAGFDAAILEPPKGAERQRLIGDLVTRFYSSYAHVAEGRGEAFVPIDDGLAIMSQHAKGLGYDAVILFLDEMILWLATHAADLNFVANEGSKLSKLVEAQNPDRPVPLVSFVARQRDLRDLVGENLAGSLQLQFADTLKYWEARFHTITLEDRNLPMIAQKRVLAPRSSSAKHVLDAAFEETQRLRPEVLETLLTSEADRAMFRQVYPFSPALMQTLIAVSSVLQRERTALKLMLQLLVDRRNELQLGELIPVGDLYDVIAEGDEPFSAATGMHFDNAKKLFNQKLLPLLERTHGVTWQDVHAGTADGDAARNLRNDARLLKTLLLAALVPEVESLRSLTGQKLAALNHGTVKAPLPGTEGRLVLSRCRDWAAEVGEIKLTEEANPVISVQITGVDTDPIIANAKTQDNPGNRRRKIREMLYEALDIEEGNDIFTTYTFPWRGTRREVDVVYDNVREMSDDRLGGRGGDAWTIALDFPFDDPGHSPRDDLARLGNFEGTANTLVWLPSFLSEKALNDLGRLVILDHILTGERFNDYAGHLSSVDRGQAKALLTNQRSVLQQRLSACLRVAYGIDTDPKDAVHGTLDGDHHFQSLDKTLRPRPPVGATLKAAFDQLLDQLFAYRFPAHPHFDVEVKPAVLKKVQPIFQDAIGAEQGRVHVPDKAVRQLVRSTANPLKLGEMGETHFVLGRHWREHFDRLHAREGGAITVAKLRGWIDQPQPMGLPREAENLVILTFADQTNRSFFLRGGRIAPSLDNLPDELELREQTLPSKDNWREAVRRAQLLFGLTPPEVLNAANVGTLVDKVRSNLKEVKPAIDSCSRELPAKLHAYGVDLASADRLITTRSAQALLAGLETASDDQIVSVLAKADLKTSDTALAQTIGRAKIIDEILRTIDWDLFEAAGKLTDHRKPAAEGISNRVREILSADEHAIALKPAIDEARRKALKLLTEAPLSPPQPPAPPSPRGDVIERDKRKGLAPSAAGEVLTRIEKKLGQSPDYRLDIEWEIRKRGTGE
jgi:hypothetical protein